VTPGRWLFALDRGGTFTDCIAFPPDGGAPVVRKLLSADDAPLVAIRSVLGLGDADAIPPVELRLGTTVATNALLERAGTPTVLVVTRGFGDLLRIGDQTRPEIFAREITTPAVLHGAVVEVDARASQRGEVLERPGDHEPIVRALAEAYAAGHRAAAIVVQGGNAAPELERQLESLARQAGFDHVVCSHAIGRQPGLLARADTTLTDAYTTPLVRRYLDGLQRALPGSRVHVMQSSGGLASASTVRGRDLVVSGPAGGVLAVAAIARRHGLSGAIGLDMGGTSTDVCRIGDGEPERAWESQTAGVRIRTPVLALHTIAAGGGSICAWRDGRLHVGPHSAGAVPGPACYGHPQGTALTLGDVAVTLGRVVPDRFALPLQPSLADAALARAWSTARDAFAEPIAMASGLFDVANVAIAEAIRKVTIARGHDARDHGLVVFGGAGGQHACAVARALGIRTVVVPPFAGVLSAWGIGRAAVRWTGEADLERRRWDDESSAIAQARADAVLARGRAALRATGDDTDGELRIRCWLELGYGHAEGTVDVALHGDVVARFEAAHLAAYGWLRERDAIVAIAVRVQIDVDRPEPAAWTPAVSGTTVPRRIGRVWLDGAWHDVPIHDREALGTADTIVGPALVLDDTGTFVLEPQWRASVADDGSIVARDASAPALAVGATTRDPVSLEIYAHRFMAIAEQMGTVLRRTASSTNIRERLDFSCAMFDADANLVANAPHLPVHLGAMGESVAAVARAHPDARPGDVFATNDPSGGGSHLPDITVVTPVFVADALAFWVASRGHHADVGGITPGSMPPFATTLAEEGVVLTALPIVRGGRWQEHALRAALAAGPWPARRPDENLADLQAQVAANATGAQALLAMVAASGLDRVTAYMRHVQDQAADAVGAAIARLGALDRSFVDTTDDGLAIAVRLRTSGDALVVDFTGTSPAVATNLNAPRAVAVAAVLYVLRTLVGEPIPLNRGCLRPVTLVIPPGSLLDPPAGHAVAGGNVETSQRVVDVLFAALAIKAASAGTMNNLTFGDGSFGYYETLGGGEGATATAHGHDAVQTHMTNTRITDAELLELRFPVRVRRFAIRRGSGGAGRRHGGDGLVRELEFLAPLSVAMLADRRMHPPFGLCGGMPGVAGRTSLDARWLGGRFAVDVTAGSRLVVETPGGGGYGDPAPPTPAGAISMARPAGRD
jgi:5-oxoprolinase (ATP-hydrolysing)